MEVTFQTNAGRRVVQNVVDCSRQATGYEMLLDDDTTRTVDGFLVAITTEWNNVGYGSPHFKNAAVKLSTDGQLAVPVRPLAEGSSVTDETWEYEDGFDFGVPEIEPSDDSCIVRNISTFADERAVLQNASDDNAAVFGQNAGDDNIGFEGTVNEPTTGTYGASFSSGWTSIPMQGVVERATSYRESHSVERLSPTSATYDSVSWAF